MSPRLTQKTTRKSHKYLTSRAIIAKLRRHRDNLNRFSLQRIGVFRSPALRRQGRSIGFIVEFTNPSFDNYMELVDFLQGLFKKRVVVLTPEGLDNIRIKSVADDVRRNVVYV